MKELYIQYCYSTEQWGLYHPDIDDTIYLNDSLENVISYAYELSDLIKPCKVTFTPQYLLNSFTICTSF